MSKNSLCIATRQSPLALWQAHHIRNCLLTHWPTLHITLLPMLTSGDQFFKDALSTQGGKGLFVKELEEALLDGRADLAVHSMKDMPALLPQGLCLPTICQRHNPLDALISPHYASWRTLPKEAIIGTTSLRRQSQLLYARPDLQIKPLRGNIHTRLKKLQTGEYDAIILAAAGLQRIGLEQHIKEILSADIMLPACGQGALGIECRENDERVKHYLTPLNDPLSALCVTSERRVNAQLGGNCHVPLAVYCTITESSQLQIRAKVASIDGKIVITHTETGSQKDAEQLADTCAESLLNQGADALLRTS